MPGVATTDVRVLLPMVASCLALLAALVTVCVCVRKKPPLPLQQVSRDGNKVGVQENKDNHKHREQFYATVCKMSPHRDPTAVDRIPEYVDIYPYATFQMNNTQQHQQQPQQQQASQQQPVTATTTATTTTTTNSSNNHSQNSNNNNNKN
ncbi:myb-like protein AA isoform X1 [Scylla paramamosain]|uniref:myb-like protein AA isoform X5 n=1 Tax=Scylla paramamosain TaxID=85552 RepID=UPI003082C18E